MNASPLETRAVPATQPTRHEPPASTWLQVLPHLDRQYGGLSAVVPVLSEQLQRREGLAVRLAAFCAPDEDVQTGQSDFVDVTVLPLGHIAWLTKAGVRAELAQCLEACGGAHIHGLWDSSSMATAHLAQTQGKPYLVSAHGMLEPWALAQKALKKRMYGALVERPLLQRAACLHALTLAEAEDYRRYGCNNPIAVIPNAVEAPETIVDTSWRERFPSVETRRTVLFLGRLHMKKGVALLLEAWRLLAAQFPDALLVLAGPGEPTYVQQLQEQVRTTGLGDSVLFTGMLDQTSKWAALSQAHVFVLPSFSEGLSVATLEALSVGTPVIVTEECHLPEVLSAGCGWQIAPSAEQLQQALQQALQQSPADRSHMSHNARQLVKTRFSWAVVCKQMAELYRCVLSGEMPQHCQYLEAVR